MGDKESPRLNYVVTCTKFQVECCIFTLTSVYSMLISMRLITFYDISKSIGTLTEDAR